MERIIIDCDPGHDDAVALAMARGLSDKIKVEAIIATYGNQSIDKTLTNTLNLAQALKYDAPVYTGSLRPLIRERVAAGYIHGENGLAGPVFPPCTRYCNGNGITTALDLVINNPGEITFVSVGPFTDLAVCIKADPRFAKSLKRIVVMGGAINGSGNVTPSAEFNVYADPEAAQIVFNSGVDVVMFGLDVTLQLTLSDEIIENVKKMPATSYTPIFLAAMECYVAACKEYVHDYPSMHDPCTIAYLADPSIFEFERRSVQVDCKSELNYGRTVAAFPNGEGNVLVGVKANKEKFWSLFYEALSRLP